MLYRAEDIAERRLASWKVQLVLLRVVAFEVAQSVPVREECRGIKKPARGDRRLEKLLQRRFLLL
jgi:hypothetical protein